MAGKDPMAKFYGATTIQQSSTFKKHFLMQNEKSINKQVKQLYDTRKDITGYVPELQSHQRVVGCQTDLHDVTENVTIQRVTPVLRPKFTLDQHLQTDLTAEQISAFDE